MLSSVFKALAVTTALAVTLPTSFSAVISKRSVAGPVMEENFPDPSVIEVDGVWYAFSTNGLGKRIPMATSSDFESWSLMEEEPLPDVGTWSNGKDVWAPDVLRRPDGGFVMYYAAKDSDGNKHCIGAATSDSVTGPYTPADDAITCPSDQGGAIDPDGFVDSDGSIYITYKIDGNSIGNGGNCGNSVDPIVPTPIMLQKMSSDGVTPDGEPLEILDRSDDDGPLIEASSLVKTSEGVYVLFFSSNCYSSSLYDVSYATATDIRGPYTKAQAPDAPLMVTGDPYEQLFAPGGADVTPDGTRLVFHADKGETSEVRQMYTASIKIEGNVVTI